jgi:hypothetical protein
MFHIRFPTSKNTIPIFRTGRKNTGDEKTGLEIHDYY